MLILMSISVSAFQPIPDIECCYYYMNDQTPPSDVPYCDELDLNKAKCSEMIQVRNDDDKTSVSIDIFILLIILGISIWKISTIGLKRYFLLKWYWLLVFWLIAIVSISTSLPGMPFRSCGFFYECTPWFYMREYWPLVLFLLLLAYTVTNIVIHIHDKIRKK